MDKASVFRQTNLYAKLKSQREVCNRLYNIIDQISSSIKNARKGVYELDKALHKQMSRQHIYSNQRKQLFKDFNLPKKRDQFVYLWGIGAKIQHIYEVIPEEVYHRICQ